ncbi:hypothetical protein MSAN_00232400 [Mycena sanguinolenta]|uniref:Uncharacterized protein n=1 Tax=Mycena sanguinolenta TaxID=230812 RepID=A0A8H6ZIM9_9AGAR|nr:hypothetical protein MSAN_00232400 [Mycena sanguinolenta]
MPHTSVNHPSTGAICGQATLLPGSGCQNIGSDSDNRQNNWLDWNSPAATPSSLLFFTLSLIPSNVFRYPTLAVAVISLVVYSIYSNSSSARLTRVNDIIIEADSILTRAKAECMRNHSLLAEYETRLLRTKLFASEIHSQILEIHVVPWKHYVQNRMAISRSLAKCEHELRDIQTSLLVLIEAVHQRKLAEDLNLNPQIVDGLSSLTFSGPTSSARGCA